MGKFFTAQYRKMWAAFFAGLPAVLAIGFPETAGLVKNYIIAATPIVEGMIVAMVPNAD